jgi:GTP-binding protein
VHDWEVVNGELRAFSEDLTGKPQVVAANKIDALADRARLDGLKARCREAGIPFHAVSVVTGEGIRGLLEEVWTMLAARSEVGAALSRARS